MYACLCIHINYTTQHIIATRTGTGAVLIEKTQPQPVLGADITGGSVNLTLNRYWCRTGSVRMCWADTMPRLAL
jgi:hypothetical protein